MCVADIIICESVICGVYANRAIVGRSKVDTDSYVDDTVLDIRSAVCFGKLELVVGTIAILLCLWLYDIVGY